MQKGPTLKMRKRLNRVVSFVLAVTCLFLAFQVLRISVFSTHDGEKYGQIASSQQLRTVTVNPERGVIYDTNMNALARSYTVWTVYVSPTYLSEAQVDIEKLADGLSQILGDVDKETIMQKANNADSANKNYYEVIKKKVEYPEVQAIDEFLEENDIVGVYSVADSKRSYPNGTFLSSVIGFTNADNEGQYGLEAYYEDELKGSQGKIVAQKNARGTDMANNYEKYYEAQNGNSLVLTIDQTIQYYLEEALDEAVVTHQVKNRTAAIAMDVNSGAILGMATKPDFDLNDPRSIADSELAELIESLTGDEKEEQLAVAREAQWKNKAITEIYEPGSVFKIITGSAALEEGTEDLNSTFTDPGSITIASATMRCWKSGGHGHQNFTEIFINSCNPAFVQVGQKLGANLFYKYLKGYGFTERTGIDLPGESESLTYALNDIGPVELGSQSFGQSNKVTPLQMITAACAAVNGGTVYTPYVVRQILDAEGNVVENKEPEVKRQIISEDTSVLMREILEQVVSANGGNNAYITGYKIGGKSGTSEKLDNKTDDKERISSFLAFAPADDPQIAVLVNVDTPTAGEVYGSIVAGPVMNQIMSKTLPYIGVEPKYTAEEMEQLEVAVPNLLDMDIESAQSKLTASELNAKVQGNGSTVIKQVPAASSSVQKGAQIILYTEDDGNELTTEVPNVLGMTPSQANERLTNAGLNIQVSGGAANSENAQVTKQVPEAGTRVSQGTVITIQVVNTSVQD